MSKIKKFLNGNEKVYIYFSCEQIARRFMHDAENEGFKFGDGKKPTEKELPDIVAIYKNMEISYLTFVGHMAFKSKACTIPKIDYKELLSR